MSEQFASDGPLSAELLAKMDACWRAANYLSAGQIYLRDNPLLGRPLTLDDIKPRLPGHWGATPGLNFLYVHWNRIIRDRGLYMILIAIFIYFGWFDARVDRYGTPGNLGAVAFRIAASTAAATILWYAFESPTLRPKRYF